MEKPGVFDDDLIKLRLDASSEAQRRSRLVLVVIGIACSTIIVACYNAYLSFGHRNTLYGIASKPELLDTRDAKGELIPVPARAFTAVSTDELMKHYATSWADSRYVSISFLGIRVSVDDAPIVGAAALFVLSIWFLLSTRRENHTICSLLQDTASPRKGKDYAGDRERQLRVYHGIVSHSVFSTYSKTLVPASGPRKAAMQSTACEGPGKLCFHCSEWRKGCIWSILQWLVLSCLVYGVVLLPVLTSAFSFALDRYSYGMRSLGRSDLSAAMTLSDVKSLALSDAVFLAFFVPLCLTTGLTIWHNVCTERAVNEYRRGIVAAADEDM